ncbi:hypothetical protein ACVWZL_005561 [Bradyrhizobium sp. GM2.4]
MARRLERIEIRHVPFLGLDGRIGVEMVVENERGGAVPSLEHAQHVRPVRLRAVLGDLHAERFELARDQHRDRLFLGGRQIGIQRIAGTGLAGADQLGCQFKPALLRDARQHALFEIRIRRADRHLHDGIRWLTAPAAPLRGGLLIAATVPTAGKARRGRIVSMISMA